MKGRQHRPDSGAPTCTPFLGTSSNSFTTSQSCTKVAGREGVGPWGGWVVRGHQRAAGGAKWRGMPYREGASTCAALPMKQNKQANQHRQTPGCVGAAHRQPNHHGQTSAKVHMTAHLLDTVHPRVCAAHGQVEAAEVEGHGGGGARLVGSQGPAAGVCVWGGRARASATGPQPRRVPAGGWRRVGPRVTSGNPSQSVVVSIPFLCFPPCFLRVRKLPP